MRTCSYSKSLLYTAWNYCLYLRQTFLETSLQMKCSCILIETLSKKSSSIPMNLLVLLLFLFIPSSTTSILFQPPSVTLSSSRLSAYQISLPADLPSALPTNAPLIVSASTVKFTSFVDIPNLPSLTILAHTCTSSRQSSINIDISSDLPVPTPVSQAPPERTPSTPPQTISSGNVVILCQRLVNVSSVLVTSRGSIGRNGGRGGSGAAGLPTVKASKGRCSLRGSVFRKKCKIEGVNPGRKATNGEKGAKGGKGGKGGNGGNVDLFLPSSFSKDKVVIRNEGGKGGKGGAGGPGGVKGKFESRGSIIIECERGVFRCKSKGFLEGIRIFIDLPPKDGEAGDNGSDGDSGEKGKIRFLTNISNSDDIVSTGDISRFVRLLERHYTDLILAGSGNSVSEGVLRSVQSLTSGKTGSAFLATANVRATTFLARLQAGNSLFGAGLLTRVSPETLSDDLDRAIDLARDVNDELSDALSDVALANIVVAAASSTVSKANLEELEAAQRLRRNNREAAIRDLDRQIKVTGVRVRSAIARANSEASAKNGQVLALISAGVGLFGAAAGRDPFGAIQSTIEIGQIVSEIREDARSRCSSSNLLEFVEVDPETRNDFPNKVDFASDFSKIIGFGAVGTLQRSNIGLKATQLTSELSCVFDADLSTFSDVEASFNQFFLQAQTRVDILAEMIDIDISLNTIRVQNNGIDRQRRELNQLSTNINSASRASVYDVLVDLYESARFEVLLATARLSASYSNLVLRPLDDGLRSYGRRRLEANGGIQSDFLDLVQLRADTRGAFASAGLCFYGPGSLADVRFYSFELSNETHPDLFQQGLRTGSDGRIPITLSINTDCALFDGSDPPELGQKRNVPRRQCVPNLTRFNARLLSMAVEFVGGNRELLSKRAQALRSVGVDQIGQHSYRASAKKFVLFEVPPLAFPLDDIPLRDTSGKISFSPVCGQQAGSFGVQTLALSPLTCPSPFATYLFQFGDSSNRGIDRFLRSVRKIRIHAEISTNRDSC